MASYEHPRRLLLVDDLPRNAFGEVLKGEETDLLRGDWNVPKRGQGQKLRAAWITGSNSPARPLPSWRPMIVGITIAGTSARIAQTAATIDALSGGRFTLGIGSSGAQVIEGWHGVPFEKPLGRTRDTVDICRKVWSGDKVAHDGAAVTLPLPPAAGTGLGKPLKFMNRVARADIPIVIASIGPSNVEMTAQVADGWQPIHFVPDRFDRVWGAALAAGRAKRSANLGPLSIFGDAQLAIGEGRDVAEARDAARNTIGFYVRGMGAKSKNYYNDLFRRYGWEDEAEQIQDLFLGGKRAEAMAAVPDEYIDSANLLGTEEHIKGRLGVYEGVRVTHLLVSAHGDGPTRRPRGRQGMDQLSRP